MNRYAKERRRVVREIVEANPGINVNGVYNHARFKKYRTKLRGVIAVATAMAADNEIVLSGRNLWPHWSDSPSDDSSARIAALPEPGEIQRRLAEEKAANDATSTPPVPVVTGLELELLNITPGSMIALRFKGGGTLAISAMDPKLARNLT